MDDVINIIAISDLDIHECNKLISIVQRKKYGFILQQLKNDFKITQPYTVLTEYDWVSIKYRNCASLEMFKRDPENQDVYITMEFDLRGRFKNILYQKNASTIYSYKEHGTTYGDFDDYLSANYYKMSPGYEYISDQLTEIRQLGDFLSASNGCFSLVLRQVNFDYIQEPVYER